MIRIEIMRRNYLRGEPIRYILSKLGFIKFKGIIKQYDNIKRDSLVIEFYPTIQDLLTKRFETNYRYPWQRQKEILFKRFGTI